MVNICTLIGQTIGSRCALCGAPASGLCDHCASALPRNRHACRRCALPLPPSTPADTLCADCQRTRPAYDSAIAPLLYQSPVDDLIAGFKYHHRLHLGQPLAGLLVDAVDRQAPLPQLLLPVPMHPRNLRDRGFNQAAELVRQLSRHLAIPGSLSSLQRHGETTHQRGLNRARRLRNLAGSFACSGPLPAHVALVDDVITTGATVEQLSRTLKKAGAEEVEVWAVARTARDRRYS